MDNEIREHVLGLVAGMRGEKRAAKPSARSVKWLVSKLRRGKSLLTGSHLRRLEAHRGVMGSNARRLEESLARAENEYKGVFNSDPLRTHNFSMRRGDMDIVPRPPDPLDDNLPRSILMRQHSRAQAKLPGLRAAYDRLLGRSMDMQARLRQLDSMVGSEARAVRNARFTAGGLGALGIGGAGYGTYRAMSGEKKAAEAVKSSADRVGTATKAVKFVRRCVKTMRDNGIGTDGQYAGVAKESEALRKQAALPAVVQQGLQVARPVLQGGQRGATWASRLARPFQRYWQLLRGGNPELVGRYHAFTRALTEKMLFGGFDPATVKKMEAIRNSLYDARQGRVGQIFYGKGGRVLFNPNEFVNPAVRSELNKALGTQVATGVGIGGLGYGAYKAMSGEEKAAAAGAGPDALAKQAAMPQWIGRVASPFRRYWQLLRGGDMRILGEQNCRMRRLARISFNATNKRYAEKARQAYEASVSPAVRSELNKAIAAQFGTGAVLGGAGLYGIHRLASGAPDDGAQ